MALVDRDADRLDKAADEFGAFFDHLRQVGIRGFVADRASVPALDTIAGGLADSLRELTKAPR